MVHLKMGLSIMYKFKRFLTFYSTYSVFLITLSMTLSLSVSVAETDSADNIVLENNANENTTNHVKQCGICHGKDGNSTINTIPSIAGINPGYFKFSMEAYKNGNRQSAAMKTFADNLSSNDVFELAKYYAEQTYQPTNQQFDEEIVAKGKTIHDKYCAKCHDNNGYPDPYSYGILAGQWKTYLQQVIKEYLDGTRKTNPMMLLKLQRVKNEIGDDGFEQLIDFYASVKAPPTTLQ